MPRSSESSEQDVADLRLQFNEAYEDNYVPEALQSDEESMLLNGGRRRGDFMPPMLIWVKLK